MRVAWARPVLVAAHVAPLIAVVVGAGSGKLAAIALALAVLVALHGFGRVLSAWAGEDDAPLGLVLGWGAGAYVALAGVLIAGGGFGPGARIGVVAAGTILGVGWLWGHAAALVASLRVPRATTVLAVGLAVTVIAIVVLAAAGRWSGPFTDGETNYLGQLRRLDDTGGLADGFGFPRAHGLGGQVALASLATPLDARAGYLVDRGVLFVIAILLAVARVRRSPRAAVVVAAALPLALTAVAEYLVGMAPYGSLIVLAMTAAATTERAIDLGSGRVMLLAVLAAAAAATIAHAAVVFAAGVIAAGATLVSGWNHGGRWWRRRASLIAAAVIAPYLIATVHARLVSPYPRLGHATAASIAAGAGVGVVLALLGALALPGRALRLIVIAAGASVALAGVIYPTPAGVAGYALPIAIAVVLVIGLESVADSTWRDAPAAAALAVTAAVGLFAAARFQAGGSLVGWRTRAVELVDDARALGRVPAATDTRLAAAYAAAQARVPAGSELGLWVERPDLVRYDRNPVIDLRSGAARRVAARLPRLHLDYVLVDEAATGDAWHALDATSDRAYQADGLVVLAVRAR